jgi:alpha-beta hydrolase superfamily lysophospholipase
MSDTGSTRAKPLLVLGACLAGAAASFVGGVALFAYCATRPPRRRRQAKAIDDLICEDVEFPASDGTPLRGWFLPAARPRAAILLCHGYRGNREHLIPHARFLRAAGYSCLLFDFRAAGESKGSVCTFGYVEALDVRGAIHFLLHREDTSDLPIGGLGLSMGGVALMMAAQSAPELRAVVAEGIYPSLGQAIARRCQLMFGRMGTLVEPIVMEVVRRQIGAHPNEISPLSISAQLQDFPTLFIHAGADRFLDDEHAEAFLDRAAGPKALWRSGDASHCRAVEADPETYASQVLEFFSAHGL